MDSRSAIGSSTIRSSPGSGEVIRSIPLRERVRFAWRRAGGFILVVCARSGAGVAECRSLGLAGVQVVDFDDEVQHSVLTCS